MSIKPGIKTTELWLTVATHAAWIVAFIFHRDVSAYVPAVAAGMAAVATAVYAASRAGLKRPHNLADLIADAEALEPSLVALIGDGKAVAEKLKPAKKAPLAKTAGLTLIEVLVIVTLLLVILLIVGVIH